MKKLKRLIERSALDTWLNFNTTDDNFYYYLSCIEQNFAIDLRRMDKMIHYEMPKKKGINAFQASFEPTRAFPLEITWRFRIKIQYGKIEGTNFEPLGEPILTQSEALPFLS